MSNTSTLPHALSATRILPSLSACTAYGFANEDATSLPMIISFNFLPNVFYLTSSVVEILYRYFILGGSGGSGHMRSASFLVDAQPVMNNMANATTINFTLIIF